MKNIFVILALISTFAANTSQAEEEKGNTDVGSSNLAQESGSQYLYAECKIRSCKVVGVQANSNDYFCNSGSHWSNGTVQVYKYAGTSLEKQHDGLVSIQNGLANPETRVGNVFIDQIKIRDGVKNLEVLPENKGQGYRNFRIDYSTRNQLITTGTAEIESMTGWRQYISLELFNCQTIQ